MLYICTEYLQSQGFIKLKIARGQTTWKQTVREYNTYAKTNCKSTTERSFAMFVLSLVIHLSSSRIHFYRLYFYPYTIPLRAHEPVDMCNENRIGSVCSARNIKVDVDVSICDVPTTTGDNVLKNEIKRGNPTCSSCEWKKHFLSLWMTMRIWYWVESCRYYLFIYLRVK